MIKICRGNGDEIDRERIFCQRADLFDLLAQDFRGSVSAGETSEASGVADRRDEIRFRHPCHRTAENGVLALQKIAAPLHQGIQIFEFHSFPPLLKHDGRGYYTSPFPFCKFLNEHLQFYQISSFRPARIEKTRTILLNHACEICFRHRIPTAAPRRMNGIIARSALND